MWAKGSPGAFPSRPPAQVCKQPEAGLGTPAPLPSLPPTLPCCPQPSAALAVAEPGLMVSVLAPSEQDQCLGRNCGQSPTCTLHPPSTVTVVPLGPGEGRDIRVGRREVGPHCLLHAAPIPPQGLPE